MQEIKKYLKVISPFNNMDEIPKSAYIVKKLLAFFVIYMAAAFIGEGIVIAILLANGYDFMHGVMPSDSIMNLLTYYGFIIYLLVTLVYCKFVEKRPIKSMGFNKSILEYILGMGIAAILLIVIMVVTSLLGGSSYLGIGKDIDWIYLFVLLGGFVIQGMAEEAMCRGFLMKSLEKKIPLDLTILVSATAFAFPHFSTLFEAEFQYAVVGTINLYLIAAIFSLLILRRSNIWIACGLHSVWNFLLYGVFGLSVSGSGENLSGVICFQVDDASIINGGQYGIEASIITTVVLGVFVVILCKGLKTSKVENKNGI